MQDQDDQAAANVEDRHNRYQLACHFTDTLDAAQQYQCHQYSDDDAGRQFGDVERAAQGVSNRVGLDGVADAEAGEHAKNGKEHTKPFPFLAQAVLDVIHRAANVVATGILLAIAHGQNGLAEFGCHAYQGNNPHPEQRARATQKDRGSDARDVTGADGGGEGGHQGVERADVTLITAFAAAPEHAEAVEQLALRCQLET